LNRRLFVAFGCFIWLGLGKVDAQAPSPDFSATPAAGCGPLGVQFTDQSGGSPLFWSWDFGNGQTSNQKDPYVVYSSPGSYTVTLIVRNKDGSNAVRKDGYITVYPFPNVAFTSNLQLACAPTTIQFTDKTDPRQGSLVSWKWDFGDGTTSSAQNPAHSYTQPGYYTIVLTTANSGGCSNTGASVRYIRIVDGIQPNFNYAQVSPACTPPFNVNFVNQTAGPGNLSYAWNFGTGANPAGSNLANPTNITFPNSGNYTVNLQVNSSMGCSQTLQKTINFSQYTASFTAPASTCVNSPVTFTNTSTPVSPGSFWDFGDGSGGSASPATKTYSALGTYNVKLINHYPGCADSTIVPITITNAPVPAFTANDSVSCQPNFTVQFTDHSPGNPTQWFWDFGDGQTSTAQNPANTYKTSGTFTVKLTTSGGAGICSGTTVKSGYINIAAPTVSIGNADNLGTCVAGSGGGSDNISPTVHFSGITPISSYQWTANGASPGSSTSATPTFSYGSPGNYTISVTVTTVDGCTAQATSKVSVGTPAPGPAPDFTIQNASTLADITNGSVCGRDQILLTASPNNSSYTYTWNYGDGNSSGPQTSNTNTYSYSKPFNTPATSITLVVSNHGCPLKASHNLTVNGPFPNFGWKVTCDPNIAPVDFIDSSSVNATSYIWNFGDGSPNFTSPGPSTPHHVYNTLTPYNVSLTVTDGSCTQTYTKQLPLAKVFPAFTTSALTACKNTNVTLTSTTTLTPAPPAITPAQYISSYIWGFGTRRIDTTSQPFDPSGVDTNGVYQTTLTTVDIYGCQVTSAATPITIIGPTARFHAQASGGGCKNGPTVFKDLNASGLDPTNRPITSWTWTFGDGGSAGPLGIDTVSHTYADTGYYHVTLKVFDGTCYDTWTPPDSVHITSPVANFGTPDSFYCPGVPLNFLDSSIGFGLKPTWTYGDASPPDNLGSHSFATPGQTYNVTLLITDTNSCTNQITKSVNIQKPVAAFTIADTTAICTPLQTLFSSHSQFYDSLYWNFGDGATSTLPVTSHFYNTIDTFTATLYAYGPGGCYDSAQRRVLVLDPVALTKFNYGPLQHCDSVLVNFSIIVPGYTRFFLTFGDGAADNSGSATSFHIYRNPNNYRPTVQLEDSTGCIIAYGGQKVITVLGATPFYAVSKHKFCDSSIVAFTDYTISNNGFATETYTFADGSPSQTQSPGTGSFNVSNFFNKVGIWQVALKVTTDSGCSETYLDTIHVYQTPHPSFALGSLACAGIIQFDGSITAPQVDTINWAWNFGNGQTAKVQDPSVHMDAGIYTVSLITATNFGCADTTSKQITINPLPVIKGPKLITTPLGFPVTIPFTYSSDVVTYSWAPAANLDCATCPNPVATLLLSTQYIVTVTDSNSCRATDSVFIKTVCTTDNIFMPNTFSPNGDGVNDVFYPRGKSLYNVQSLTVFNRWGQMVFQRRDFPANAQDMGWDGNFNGHPAPSDAYVYIVEVICENAQVVAIHGSVTLVR
jgi:gliding motility-associated-like protein